MGPRSAVLIGLVAVPHRAEQRQVYQPEEEEEREHPLQVTPARPNGLQHEDHDVSEVCLMMTMPTQCPLN